MTLARRGAAARAEELTALFAWSPPVPLEHVAEVLHATILYRTWKPREPLGLSWSEGDRRLIAVNQAASPVVQRFTLAHELMHRLLHAPYRTPPLMITDPADSFLELEANAAAAALLVPRDWLAAQIAAWQQRTGRTPPWSPDDLNAWRTTVGPRWARQAGVSLTMLGYRLADGGWLSPSALASWRAASPGWSP